MAERYTSKEFVESLDDLQELLDKQQKLEPNEWEDLEKYEIECLVDSLQKFPNYWVAEEKHIKLITSHLNIGSKSICLVERIGEHYPELAQHLKNVAATTYGVELVIKKKND